MKQIVIVDDHAMFRTGLRLFIDRSLPEAGVREAGSLREALQLGPTTPHLVLLDIQLPGLNGVEGIALLRRQWPDVPIVMLSSLDTPEMVNLALARGADGFVSKTETAEAIAEVVRQALNKELDRAAPGNEPPSTGPRLTPRQREILDLLCQGLPNKAIANQLGLSENTVRWHVQAILEVLGVSSRSQAAFAARRVGLVH